MSMTNEERNDDSLVKALNEAFPYEMYGFDQQDANDLRAELLKRGLEIMEKDGD